MTGLFTPLRRFIAAAFLMDLCAGATGIGLQFMGKRLDASPMELGYIGTSSALAYALGCLFTGGFSDRFGRKVSLTVAAVGSATGWVFMPMATSPVQLMALGAWSAGWMSFFWPPYQAWLSELSTGGRRGLNRNMGAFNIAWTTGLMTGPVLTGHLWAWGPAAAFAFIVIAGIASLALVLSSPSRVSVGEVVNHEDEYERPHPLVGALLLLAWIASFATCASRNLIGATFPNLGLSIGYSHSLVGVITACYHLGMLGIFITARAGDWWQNRIWPLNLSMGVAAVGMLIAYALEAPVVYGAVFFVGGFAQALSFVSSQFYSLHGRAHGRGRMAGFHEAVLGAGLVAGPLIGGYVAGRFELRAPFLASTALYLLAIVACAVVWALMLRLAPRRATATRDEAIVAPLEAHEPY